MDHHQERIHRYTWWIDYAKSNMPMHHFNMINAAINMDMNQSWFEGYVYIICQHERSCLDDKLVRLLIPHHSSSKTSSGARLPTGVDSSGGKVFNMSAGTRNACIN